MTAQRDLVCAGAPPSLVPSLLMGWQSWSKGAHHQKGSKSSSGKGGKSFGWNTNRNFFGSTAQLFSAIASSSGGDLLTAMQNEYAQKQQEESEKAQSGKIIDAMKDGFAQIFGDNRSIGNKDKEKGNESRRSFK